MMRLKVSGDAFDRIIDHLDSMSRPDLGPLALKLKAIMIEDNRRGLLAGTDRDGSTTAKLSPATIRRGRGGDGPPRIPRETGSRMIADYAVEIQVTHDRILLIGGWRNTPFVHFHVTGAPKNNMPARNLAGIRPQGQEEIRQAIAEFIVEILEGG